MMVCSDVRIKISASGDRLEFKRQVLNARVIEDLKKRSDIGIVFYLVVAGIVLLSESYHSRHPDFSKLFLFSFAGICLFRLLHLPIAKWMQPKFEKFNTRIFIFSAALTAVIWGAGFANFMIHEGDLYAALLMVMCTVGLCSGEVVAFTPYFRLAIVYAFFVLVPPMGAMLFFKMNLPLVLALGSLGAYLLYLARNGNREYWDGLEAEYILNQRSKALEKMNRIDDLTDLYNRRYFDETFAFEWNRSIRDKTPISIIIFDIDDFKQINDQYGHLAGDQYLVATAGVIKHTFKRQTDITARYGGDEFIVLISNTAMGNVNILAEKVRTKLEALHLEYEGQTFQASISAGVATCVPDQKQAPSSLILKADKALYQSKTSGRNKVIENC